MRLVSLAGVLPQTLCLQSRSTDHYTIQCRIYKQTNIISNNASVSRTPYGKPNPSLFCIFCSTAYHHSHERQRYNSSRLFWEKVLVDRRCKNCLRLYHRSDKFFNRSFVDCLDAKGQISTILYCVVWDTLNASNPTLDVKNLGLRNHGLIFQLLITQEEKPEFKFKI